jgi:flagellar M-ring protein FliF
MAQDNGVLSELTLGQKAGLGLAAVALIGLSIFAYAWIYQAEFRPLYDNLNEEDAAKVLLQLQDMKVPYKLANDGHTVLVDSVQLEETRVLLDGGSLSIKGGEGFELFDNIDYGMTEFAQKINYQRAMQGELSRTIIGLKEVRYARVHLVLPEKGLFQQSATTPKASITIVQEPGYTLSRSQIAGIQKLVASAVEGMETEYVTLINELGVLLSKNQEQDEGGVGSKLGHKQEVEHYLTLKAEKILNQMFGYGSAVVNIDVSLNYDQVQVTRETFLPDEKNGERGLVVRSKTQRKYAEGEVQGQSNNRNNQPYSETTEYDYQLGKSIEQIVKASGSLERMTVSVMVPDSTEADVVESLKQLVVNAVGIDRVRGDTIEIVAVPAIAMEEFILQPDGSGSATIVGQQTDEEGLEYADHSPEMSWAPLQLAILFLLLALLIGAAFYLMLAGRRTQQSTLSDDQRGELLEEIRGWLAEEPEQAVVENA